MITELNFPTRILFGAGAVGRTDQVARDLGIATPLVVTDRGLEACGLLSRLTSVLQAAQFAVALFLDVQPNPTDLNIAAGLAAYRQGGCDGLIALGGGSAIDAAKGIAVQVNHRSSLSEYDYTRSDRLALDQPIPPVMAIPTTAGTGAEVGRAAIVTLSRISRKVAIISPRLVPAAAICDPELTLDLPPDLTATTGMDVVTHAIETYCSPEFNPPMDGIALHALRLAAGHLPIAYRDGRHLEARGRMMIAAFMAATAFRKGLGAAHALAHPLSAVCGVPHGLANAIVLPHVMRFNAASVPDRLAEVAHTLHRPAEPQAAMRAIEELQTMLHIPARLGQVGVSRQDIPAVADQAVMDHCRLTNPRPLTRHDAVQLLTTAL